MEAFFSKICNMSLTASVIIGFVLLARLALRKAPKVYSYALWSVVLFRLLCPVSISAPVSVLEVAKPVMQTWENVNTEYVLVQDAAVVEIDPQMQISPPEAAVEAAPEETEQKFTAKMLMVYVWLTGMAIMLLAGMVNYLRLHRKLLTSVFWRGEIYLADEIDTPFVLGVIRPKIYLPSGIPMGERRYIIAHERQHIRRFDPLWKLLGYFALCIHWFNPLVWVAFCLAGKDMEMSCDEAVIMRLGPDIRAEYAQTLLRLSTGRKMLSGMPLAFGEGDTKGRVKNMAKWKRPRVWVSILCIVVCAAVGLACALNPEEEQSLEELTRWEGPSSCGVGDLNYYLPEGLVQMSRETLELSDWELTKYLKEKKGIYPYEVIFQQEETIVGGVTSYYLPESFTPADYTWIEELGLWEFEDETLGRMISSGTECAWEIEFFSDLPKDTPDGILRKHYFFLSEDLTMVNDLWFDMMTVNDGLYRQILDSCEVGGGSHKEVATDALFVNFEACLPDGYFLVTDATNSRRIVKDYTMVGGITAYEKPDFDLKFSSQYPMEEWNADEWLAAMGYRKDETLAYMGGGSLYGNFERHYTSDVPEGQPITVDEHHTFFIREKYVYDVWFDMLQVPESVRDNVLSGISGRSETVVAPTSAANLPAPDLTEQEAALDRCRSVLEQVQSCSQALRCERSSANDHGVIEYWLHEEDWMTIQTHTDGSVIAFLYKNGTHYDNLDMTDGKIGARDENGNILWKEGTGTESFHIPWLSRYQWNEEAVEYLGAEQQGEEIHIQLSILEPFPGFEWGNPEYDVTMVFEEEHSFVRAELTVNQAHSSQSEFTEKETIVSLFSETVKSRIEQEHQRIIS